MLRDRERQKLWGKFVDAKINAPEVLSKELLRRKKGVVGLSTITDPYQPLEREYELTRKCLENLVEHDFSISIQTKSSLVLRDIDLIRKFPRSEVGFTIITLKEDLRKKVEPYSSPIEERFAALRELADEGVSTWVFIGPILPLITDKEELNQLVKEVANMRVEHIFLDRLNLRVGVWPAVSDFLKANYPELLPKYKKIFWLNNNYFELMKAETLELCRKVGIRCTFCY